MRYGGMVSIRTQRIDDYLFLLSNRLVGMHKGRTSFVNRKQTLSTQYSPLACCFNLFTTGKLADDALSVPSSSESPSIPMDNS